MLYLSFAVRKMFTALPVWLTCRTSRISNPVFIMEIELADLVFSTRLHKQAYKHLNVAAVSPALGIKLYRNTHHAIFHEEQRN